MERGDGSADPALSGGGGGSSKRAKKEKKPKSKDKQHRRRESHKGDGAPSSEPPLPEPDAPTAEDGEDWDANRTRVEALCMSGPNYICADCGEAGTRWASVNHGVFLCIRCSGVHRALGVHVSKVKSTNMDKWTAAEVALMEAIGNKRGKALYEARLGSVRPPSMGSTDGELRSFLERKYVHREFALENAASMLKKVYKRVGYGKYKGTGGGAVDGAALRNNNKGDEVDAAAPRTNRKALREEAMKAFYGDAAAAKMGKERKKKPHAVEGPSGPLPSLATAAADEDGQVEKMFPAGDRPHRKGREGKTVHGTFGVVNVGADVYEERLMRVLAAFGVETPALVAEPAAGEAGLAGPQSSAAEGEGEEAWEVVVDNADLLALPPAPVDGGLAATGEEAPAGDVENAAVKPSTEASSAEEKPVPTADVPIESPDPQP